MLKGLLKDNLVWIYVKKEHFERFKHCISTNGYTWINGESFQPDQEQYHPYYSLHGSEIARLSESLWQENIIGKNKLSFGVMIGEEDEKNCNQ